MQIPNLNSSLKVTLPQFVYLTRQTPTVLMNIIYLVDHLFLLAICLILSSAMYSANTLLVDTYLPKQNGSGSLCICIARVRLTQCVPRLFLYHKSVCLYPGILVHLTTTCRTCQVS